MLSNLTILVKQSFLPDKEFWFGDHNKREFLSKFSKCNLFVTESNGDAAPTSDRFHTFKQWSQRIKEMCFFYF